MTPHELFSVNQYLSSYPDDMSYSDILDGLEKESPDIIVWEPFEYFDPLAVMDFIRNTKNHLQNQFIPINRDCQKENEE
jgi:hypothetical protein